MTILGKASRTKRANSENGDRYECHFGDLVWGIVGAKTLGSTGDGIDGGSAAHLAVCVCRTACLPRRNRRVCPRISRSDRGCSRLPAGRTGLDRDGASLCAVCGATQTIYREKSASATGRFSDWRSCAGTGRSAVDARPNPLHPGFPGSAAFVGAWAAMPSRYTPESTRNAPIRALREVGVPAA